jgi:hypothetical protein
MSQLMSEQIDQLATALAKAQGEMPVAYKNSKNPFFKSMYADFESITNACVPSMSKYGLSFFQSITEEDDKSYLITVVMHSSGQWIKSKARIKPAKEDVQAFSSYNTYLKRICLSSIIGIATGEADDDGNSAAEQPRMVNHYNQPPSSIQQVIVEKISKDQLEQLEHDLDGYPEIKTKVIAALNLERLSDMPRPSFLKALNRIRELTQQEQELRNKK